MNLGWPCQIESLFGNSTKQYQSFKVFIGLVFLVSLKLMKYIVYAEQKQTFELNSKSEFECRASMSLGHLHAIEAR